MPSVQAPSKVLVTGASGYIAAHVCKILLEHGFPVVGTVRAPSKGEYLSKLFADFKPKFSFVVVDDIAKAGCFDDAVKGVDAVIHTASPFHLRADDPQELIVPAVQGTTGILESILKYGPDVRRVVITSSVAAIMTPKDKPYTFTEDDWNTYSPALIEKEGRAAPGGQKYRASKTLAERAAWEFVEKNKPSIKFDLVTINPTLVYGPPIHEVPSLEHLNESVAQLYNHISQPRTKEVILGVPGTGNWVDVRDTALSHVLALELEQASGQRFILSNGVYTVQTIYDSLREAGVPGVPIGYPGEDTYDKHNTEDGSKATRVLGVKYRSLKDSAADTINAIRLRFPDAAGASAAA